MAERLQIVKLSREQWKEWRNPVTREALKKRIFDHMGGRIQVRGCGGMILGTVRECNTRIPIEQSTARGAHVPIAPGECMCREWQKPEGEEHMHHPVCTRRESWENYIAMADQSGPRPARAITSGNFIR